MGEGYRVVAASPGLHAEEKAEMTRRCPSHGGLCNPDRNTTGMMAFTLSSGRRCVAFCCHAGREHTARGGQRVYTHLAVHDPTPGRVPELDPLYLHEQIRLIVHGDGPHLKSGLGALDRLVLPVARDRATALHVPKPPDCDPAWIWSLSGLAMSGEAIVVVGAPDSLGLLRWVLLSMPANMRERLPVSAQVTFSPARDLSLVITNEPLGGLERRMSGRAVRLVRFDAEPPAIPDHLAAWFRLLDDWKKVGRAEDIARLTLTRAADACVDQLAAIAESCREDDRQRKETAPPDRTGAKGDSEEANLPDLDADWLIELVCRHSRVRSPGRAPTPASTTGPTATESGSSHRDAR